jgi:hypothetical protein
MLKLTKMVSEFQYLIKTYFRKNQSHGPGWLMLTESFNCFDGI